MNKISRYKTIIAVVSVILLNAATLNSALASSALLHCALPTGFSPVETPFVWQTQLSQVTRQQLESQLDTTGQIKTGSADDATRKSVVFVNLWAQWCPPCLKELPMLDQLARTLEQSAVEVNSLKPQVIALHLGGNPRAIAADLQQRGLTALYPFVEPNVATLNALKLIGLPATLVAIDGQVHFHHMGYLPHTSQALAQWLNCLSDSSLLNPTQENRHES
ncbi:TlpA family protein disulfide reductase [Vibrio sp. SM6]|uniref:TlpA family protein disulfide reductase n=1 Tax=Vibrio agarilyticus TaxID=2726741 RepID=A0A7X8TPL9_9VIBR|nr:TlpA disulfide reductase family protein [Vibrio agarilyticus]NLS12501.1 TlpA family protein disulfide reductase [Vibrio agarilyticus]